VNPAGKPRETGSGVSVVVPCYNSASRLPDTLTHLARQRVRRVPWEVIVIDNASTDDTAEVARAVWDATGSAVPFRVVAQPVKGLSAARMMGFRQARYDYVLFCDDDAWLCEDYVARAHEIMERDPRIGVLGGRGTARFEVPPPDWFERYQVYYAVGPQASASGDVSRTKGYVYGAGFVIRKEGWESLQRLGFRFIQSGRRGKALTAGEDVELCFALRLLGYTVWYDETLRFEHYMPGGRLDWRYFLRLVAGAHQTTPINRAYEHALGHDGVSGKPPARSRWIGECGRLVLKALRFRKVPVLAVYRDLEGYAGLVNLYRIRGALRGWLKVRSGYATEASRLARFRAAAAGTVAEGQPGPGDRLQVPG
jgi:glycosyltransferase involved in cell wall biosynthesis